MQSQSVGSPLTQEEKLDQWRLERQRQRGNQSSASVGRQGSSQRRSSMSMHTPPNRTPLSSLTADNNGVSSSSSSKISQKKKSQPHRRHTLSMLQKPPLLSTVHKQAADAIKSPPDTGTPMKWISLQKNRPSVSPLCSGIDRSEKRKSGLTDSARARTRTRSPLPDESPSSTHAAHQNNSFQLPSPMTNVPKIKLPRLSESRLSIMKASPRELPVHTSPRSAKKKQRYRSMVPTPERGEENSEDDPASSPDSFQLELESPDEAPARRRFAGQILLPIPSLRDEKINPNKRDGKSPTEIAPKKVEDATTPQSEASESVFGWHESPENGQIDTRRARRAESASILLPIPSLRQEIEKLPKDSPAQSNQASPVVDSPEKPDLSGNMTGPEQGSPEELPSSPEKPVEVAFHPFNVEKLSIVPEEVEDDMAILREQLRAMQFENAKLRERVSYETRVEPFRDAFEQLRKVCTEKNQLQGIVENLQQQTLTAVQLALQKKEELEATQEKLTIAEAKIAELQGSQM